MESEIISWPSLWRADCAACFAARCRIPRPARKPCGAGPRACTAGRHSVRERPGSRGSSAFPLLILIYVSLVQPRTHSPSTGITGSSISVKNSIILFSASLSRQSCAIALGMGLLDRRVRGPDSGRFGLSVSGSPTYVTTSARKKTSARPQGKEARHRGIVPRNAWLCLDAGGLPDCLFSRDVAGRPHSEPGRCPAGGGKLSTWRHGRLRTDQSSADGSRTSVPAVAGVQPDDDPAGTSAALEPVRGVRSAPSCLRPERGVRPVPPDRLSGHGASRPGMDGRGAALGRRAGNVLARAVVGVRVLGALVCGTGLSLLRVLDRLAALSGDSGRHLAALAVAGKRWGSRTNPGPGGRACWRSWSGW